MSIVQASVVKQANLGAESSIENPLDDNSVAEAEGRDSSSSNSDSVNTSQMEMAMSRTELVERTRWLLSRPKRRNNLVGDGMNKSNSF